jgi:hypothetical protein
VAGRVWGRTFRKAGTGCACRETGGSTRGQTPRGGREFWTQGTRVPFGFGHKSLEHKLAEDGRRAPAVVVGSEPTKHFDSSYGNELNGRTWILRLRVQPTDEPAFEVELKASLKVMFMPRAGDPIDVLYDPSDHSRTIVDPALELAPQLRSDSEFRAECALPLGQEAIVEAQSAPPEHRAELDSFAHYYANGGLSDDEYREIRRRILGLPETPRPTIEIEIPIGKDPQ